MNILLIYFRMTSVRIDTYASGMTFSFCMDLKAGHRGDRLKRSNFFKST